MLQTNQRHPVTGDPWLFGVSHWVTHMKKLNPKACLQKGRKCPEIAGILAFVAPGGKKILFFLGERP